MEVCFDLRLESLVQGHCYSGKSLLTEAKMCLYGHSEKNHLNSSGKEVRGKFKIKLFRSLKKRL